MTIFQIQCLLAYLGYYTITVDGIWGPGSEQATKDFQAAEGLEDDGIPGKLTQAALLDAVANGRFKQDDAQPESGPSTEDDIWAESKYFVRAEFACPCGRCGGFPVEMLTSSMLFVTLNPKSCCVLIIAMDCVDIG